MISLISPCRSDSPRIPANLPRTPEANCSPGVFFTTALLLSTLSLASLTNLSAASIFLSDSNSTAELASLLISLRSLSLVLSASFSLPSACSFFSKTVISDSDKDNLAFADCLAFSIVSSSRLPPVYLLITESYRSLEA